MGGRCSQSSSGGSQCHAGAGTAKGMALANPDTRESAVAARVSFPCLIPSDLCQGLAVGEPTAGRESGKCSSGAGQSPGSMGKDLRTMLFKSRD